MDWSDLGPVWRDDAAALFERNARAARGDGSSRGEYGRLREASAQAWEAAAVAHRAVWDAALAEPGCGHPVCRGGTTCQHPNVGSGGA